MKKSGFTLIELIGVISIISILSLLFFPSLVYQFKANNKKMDKTTEQIIIDSSKLYIDNNSKYYDKSNTYCISIATLINNGYLEDNFTEFDKNYLVKNKAVKAIGDGTLFNFLIVDDDECQ